MSHIVVSVVMIFFNSEKYIEDAIKSVLGQTFQNFELILVDDGSTDCSKKIAQRYCDNNSAQVKLVFHEGNENKGMSASRNLGVRHSKGEFMAFLDSDDVWLTDKLAEHTDMLSAIGADVLLSPSTYWFSWDTGMRKTDKIRPTFPKKGVVISGSEVFLEWMDGNIPCPHLASLLLKKEFVQSSGLFEADFRGMFEDQVFMVKLLTQKNIIVVAVSEPKDLYRQHSESCVATSRKNGNFLMRKQNNSQDRFVEWLTKYKEETIQNEYILDAIEIYIVRYGKLNRPRYSKFAGRIQHFGKKIKSIVAYK